MKVLVFSNVPIWEKHHLESIEIAAQHLHAGDPVWLWSCTGALLSCPANPFHDRLSCISCRQFTHATRRLEILREAHKLSLQLGKLSPDVEQQIPRSALELRAFTYKGAPVGEMVVSQLHDEQRDTVISDYTMQSRGRELVIDGCKLFEAACEVITENEIDRVYAWNGRHVSEGPVLWAAKWLGRVAIAHESGLPSGKILIVPDTKVHSAAATADEACRVFAKAKEMPPAEIEREGSIFFGNQESGNAAFDGYVHFADRFDDSMPSRSTDKSLLVVFTSSSWEFAGMSDYFPPEGDFIDQYETYRQILNDPTILEKFEVWVRWHPNLVSAGPLELQDVEKTISESPHVLHIRPEDPANSYSILNAASIVVGWGSTMLAEATFRGKPAISLYPAQFDAFKVTHRAGTRDELLSLFEADLPPIDRWQALTFGYWNRTRGSIVFEWCRRIDPLTTLVGSQRYAHVQKKLRHSRPASFVISVLRKGRKLTGT